MGKHLSLYRSILEYNNDTNRVIPNVSYIKEENGNKEFYYHAKENSQFPEFPNYPGGTVNGKNYLSFTAIEDSTISINQNGNSNTVDIKYSYDRQNWIQWDYLNDTISLNKGAIVYMKGDNSSGFNTSSSIYKYFSMTGKIAAGGNIMSILYDDFEDKHIIPCSYCYSGMFDGCTSLVVAPELPATTLDNGCYIGMFHDCTSLVVAPKLPATTLAKNCYVNMFLDCTSLTTAPALPATTLAERCYSGMFGGCTSLRTAPKLPATVLANGCYESMFGWCQSLASAPELPATTLAKNCYVNMFLGCTSLTTALALPATTLAERCYSGMFGGCTSLRTAPDLPATKLTEWCYYSMFQSCRSLNYIKMLATDISASHCLTDWVHNVANNGTFIKHPNMNSLPTGENGIPSGWNIGVGIDYKRFSIINNSNNNEIIFYHNDGIYSPIKGNHIDLSYEYDKNTIYSFAPEMNLIIDIYKVSQNNIGVLKLTDVVWGSGASLKELCYAYSINDLDGIIIIIKSIDDNYNDGDDYDDYYNDDYYNDDYYNDDYYNSPKIGMHIYWSMDNGNTWHGGIYSPDENFTLSVNQGDTIMFKASRDENDIDINKNIGGYLTFNIKSDGRIIWEADDNSGKFLNSTASFDVSGNIMSLVCGDNFENKNQLNTSDVFVSIFAKTLVVNAENLILPATTLADFCYAEMFRGCTSLTTAPELPATTLADSCYYFMFHGCTSLTTAPELPATKLVDFCYYCMFYNCSSLNYIKMFATDISTPIFITAPNCLYSWVSGVANNGTFIKHPNMNSLMPGSSGIPTGWSVQNVSI